jgi:hypothetical protein
MRRESTALLILIQRATPGFGVVHGRIDHEADDIFMAVRQREGIGCEVVGEHFCLIVVESNDFPPFIEEVGHRFLDGYPVRDIFMRVYRFLLAGLCISHGNKKQKKREKQP